MLYVYQNPEKGKMYSKRRLVSEGLIHDPLRDYFQMEAERGAVEKEVGQQELSSTVMTLRMLAAWHMEEDDGIVRALLKHGSYTKQERSENGQWHVLTKQYVLRRFAKEALVARGQPLPYDVQLEAEISRKSATNK
jgi:hypothetical protein